MLGLPRESKDENRPKKTQSLRETSGKEPGGQPGHEGHTLEFSSVPDVITDHIPGFCSCCGDDLSMVAAELSSKRQVIDLPVIRPVCTGHRSYHKICRCGTKNKAAYPDHVNAPVQYGRVNDMEVGNRKQFRFPFGNPLQVSVEFGYS